MTIHLFLLLMMASIFSVLQLTASSEKSGFRKIISEAEVHSGKTRARHNFLSHPGLQLAPTVRGNYWYFKHKQTSKKGKVFGKNTYSWQAKYVRNGPKSTYPKIARDEQQIGVTLKGKTQIEKQKPLSTTRSAVRRTNSSENFENFRDSKTANANQLKRKLLKKLVTLEHKRGISTKSVSLTGSRLLDEDLAHSAKRRRGHIFNQSNVLTLHLVNSCNDTKAPVSQLCELKKVLYKLKQLRNSKNISFDKELAMKHISNQSVRAGELSMKLTLFESGGKAMLDKIQFTKSHHRHTKLKAGKRRKKFHWPHFKSLGTKGSNYKVADTPKSYFDLSQSFQSSTNLGKSLNAIDELRQITNIDRVNDVNIQQPGAANPYKAASKSSMVADELTYGAAQLDQQQMLRKFQTQQRDAALQGRMTSLANNQFNIGYPHFYTSMVNYPGSSRYRETPVFMSQYSFPPSKYRYPSWRFSLPIPGYQRYPYTLSRRRSSFSSFPWSPMSAVSYDRFLYGGFNQGHGFFGYPRGFPSMPRRFYDTDFDADRFDDDSMSNMESYNDFDGYDDNNDKDVDDEELGGDDIYRRMAVSNFRKKGSKDVKSGKSMNKD